MRDWLKGPQRLSEGTGVIPRTDGAVGPVRLGRQVLVALLTTGIVSAAKLALGDALGREAPFALLGLGVLGAGGLAGARAALLTTGFLTLVNWYLFFPPFHSLAVLTRSTAVQLVVYVFEGLTISGIVAVMERAWALQKATAQRMEALHTLAADLAAARTADEVSEILLGGTARFLGATSGVLVLPGVGEDGVLRVAATHGATDHVVGSRQVSTIDEDIPAVKAFRTGETEWIEERGQYLEKYPRAASASSVGGVPAAAASLPLYAAGRNIGGVTFQFAQSRYFSAPERSTIRGCVTQAAQALDRAQAEARGALSRSRLEALANVSSALSGASTTAEIASVIVEQGTRAMGADSGTLYVATPAKDTLDLIGHRGVPPEVLDSIRQFSAASENPSFKSLSTGQPLWGESADDYASLYPKLAAIQSQAPRARAFWSVPLMVDGRPVGLLGMGFYQPRRFSADERSFVETFTGHCAQAIARAQRVEAERQAVAVAERAEASLATTLRSIGDAVIATDTRGNVTFMNQVAEQLTGWPAAEARGRPLPSVFRIINERTREVVESPVDKVLQHGLVVGLANHTVLLHRLPGRETPIDDSGAPIRDDAGQVQGVVLVFRDVTEKKRQEARRWFLAEATATLASSLDYRASLVRLAQLMVPRFADWSVVDIVEAGSPVPVRLAAMHVDPEKIALARDLTERYPEPPDAPTGVPNVLRTGRPEIYPDVSAQMVAASARDDEHRRVLLQLQIRSAMILPLVARDRTLGAISLVHAESGRHYSTDDLAFMQDIVARAAVVIDNAQLYASEREARMVADQANRTKDEFLATVSHELRTPLNAILGWARMIAKDPDDHARTARAVAIIERNSLTMARLIEDLLDISRIISGKVRLELETIEPLRVIQAAVDAVRPSMEAKELQFSLSPADADVRAVVGDSNRLQQVLCNLLSNAIKFTPNGGRIQITTRRRGGSVEIEVRDSGKGIEATFLPHVFEPFRQADGSITRAHSGLGLGLAISRHLIDLHGGKIWARSAGLGQGAAFTVALPVSSRPEGPPALADDGAGVPVIAGAPAPVARVTGLKVLVVDDDPDARQLVRAVLEEHGVVVTVAASVDEAMRALREGVPDVLLSDIGMPGEDGYSLIRRVRALPAHEGGNVPAAALTAYTRAEDRRQVLLAGYAVHLSKPIEPDRLLAVVEDLSQRSLDNRRANS